MRFEEVAIGLNLFQSQIANWNTDMARINELREMSDEQLTFALKEAQQELFRLRFQAATEKLDAPSNLRKLRRDIARVHTIQRERELGLRTGAAS